MVAARSWSRISAALSAALNAPRAQWSQILRENLGRDSLIAEAKGLLAGNEAVSQFLEPSPPPPALANNTRVADRYQIQRFLGRGSMGEVYEAHDQLAGESVALKLLASDTSQQAVDLLRRELRLGRQIRHRNVCQMFDIHPGPPRAFITMELLQGEPLQARAEAGALSEAETECVVRQVLDGLEAAHAAGVLHGDLKASNVFLAKRPDGSERAVVMDFGLSRRLAGGSENSSIFGPNLIAGTAAYMPPEQIRGEKLSPAADLHAVGVLIFYMLTQRLPFEADSAHETMRLRLHHDAPGIRSIRPDVSKRWSEMVRWCLESKAQRRPQAVVDARRVLDGDARPPLRLRRSVLSGAGVAMAAAAVVRWPRLVDGGESERPDVQRLIAVGEEFLGRRGKDDFEKAIVEFRHALDISPQSTEAWCGLAEAYSQLTNWGMIEPQTGLREARAAAGRAVEISPESGRAVALNAYLTSIDVQRWLSANPEFEKALRLAPENSQVHFWYATHLGRTARHDEAIFHLQLALRNSPRNLSLSYLHQLAVEYFRSGQNEKQLEQAIELERLQPTLGHTFITLGRAWIQMNRVEQARQAVNDAILYRADRAQVLGILPVLELRAGNRAAARKLAEEFDTMHRQRAVERVKLASIWALLGEADRCVDVLDEGFGKGDPSVLSAHVTPWMMPVREHPRYVAFVRRTGWKGPIGPIAGSSTG